MQCEVWSVKTLLRLSLKKKAACRGKDTVGTGCLRTIGHLFLGNFRRRLARVYVICVIWVIFRTTRGRSNTSNILWQQDMYIYIYNIYITYIYTHIYIYVHVP